MLVKPISEIRKTSDCGQVFNTWLDDVRAQYEGELPPHIENLRLNGWAIRFSQYDFINPSSYRGITKLLKCNSNQPKFFKKYLGKGLGITRILGFKITDYDFSYNYVISSNINIMHDIKGKMLEEFPEYPDELYDTLYEYDRAWENIKGLSPAEKIFLANVHNETPFPHSLYENDNGLFNKRTVEMEHHLNEIGIHNQLEREKGYSIAEYELDKLCEENIEDYYSDVKEGFDYGNWEMSDIYTRVPTRIEDHELYPIRVNCYPKAVRKRGKSPYDTKLGVREYRWFNDYKQYVEPHLCINPKKKVPKYSYQMSEREQLEEEYNLPESYWEDLEKAYAQR